LVSATRRNVTRNERCFSRPGELLELLTPGGPQQAISATQADSQLPATEIPDVPDRNTKPLCLARLHPGVLRCDPDVDPLISKINAILPEIQRNPEYLSSLVSRVFSSFSSSLFEISLKLAARD